MGFVVRSRLREDPVGSYPAFSPLPGATPPQFGLVSNVRVYSSKPNWGGVVPGGLFSETLSVTWDFCPKVPPFSRGTLPSGVRTFLWPGVNHASDRLPQDRTYHRAGSCARKARNESSIIRMKLAKLVLFLRSNFPGTCGKRPRGKFSCVAWEN